MVVQVSSFVKDQVCGWIHLIVTPTSFSVIESKNKKLLISKLRHLMLCRASLFKKKSFKLGGSLYVKMTAIVEQRFTRFATTCRLTLMIRWKPGLELDLVILA